MNIDRRDFLKLGLASSAIFVSSGLQGCATQTPAVSVSFLHGVASGDPLADSVILWTRVTPDQNDSGDGSGDVVVSWQVARDADFTDLVNTGSGTTNAARDYTVKVEVRGLEPYTPYFYRFLAGAAESPFGMTKTLADGSLERVKLAVFSCSSYPTGYFHVYREAARNADIDAVLHLGDYIYEYGRDGFGGELGERLGREVEPENECVSLSDYRRRYAQYRRDGDLQALHARAPWIVVWDDHEIANDAWEEGAQNHQPASEGDYEARKQASLQAYFEWLPLRPIVPTPEGRIYRQFAFGDLVNLMMLDTRRIGRDKQLYHRDYLGADGHFDRDGLLRDVRSDQRTILGAAQRDWLVEKMGGSSHTWQLLGQQVPMARRPFPATILTRRPERLRTTFREYFSFAATYHMALADLADRGVSDPTREQLLAEGLSEDELAFLDAPSFPVALDSWDGYAHDREVVLAAALQARKNLVVLAGDSHNSWASQLTDAAGTPAGVEVTTSSVSSPGLESFLKFESETEARATEAGVTRLMDDLRYCNFRSRGYLTVTFTPEVATATWTFVDTVTSKDYRVSEAATTLQVRAGEPELTVPQNGVASVYPNDRNLF